MRFYLYKNNVQKTIRPHHADCRQCNHGEGRINTIKPPRSERFRDAWIGPLTREEAEVLIEFNKTQDYHAYMVECCYAHEKVKL